MQRTITKNKDGTFRVSESNIVENVTRDNLRLFRDKVREDIERLKKNLVDLEKQEKEVTEILKE